MQRQRGLFINPGTLCECFITVYLYLKTVDQGHADFFFTASHLQLGEGVGVGWGGVFYPSPEVASGE